MSDKLRRAGRVSSRLVSSRGFVSAGCEPDEMGVGPVYAVPAASQTTRLDHSTISISGELNEAFAVQVIYCRDKPRHRFRKSST